MSLSATSRSMGYTVFWQAEQVSFTWARRLKDCAGTDSARLGQHPPCPTTTNHPGAAYLGALHRAAAAAAAFGFLGERGRQDRGWLCNAPAKFPVAFNRGQG